MTSNKRRFLITQLVLAFQLICFHSIVPHPLPIAARNIRNSAVNKSNNQSEILVIMANGINITSIYGSFDEFKRIFGVEFPDDQRIVFRTGEGKFVTIHK